MAKNMTILQWVAVKMLERQEFLASGRSPKTRLEWAWIKEARQEEKERLAKIAEKAEAWSGWNHR